MYFPTLNVNAHNFKSFSYCLSMVMKQIYILCITIWTIIMYVQGLLDIMVKNDAMASQYQSY